MRLLKLGFTGTKDGMSIEQKRLLEEHFTALLEGYDWIEFHHGDCIGADAQAATMLRVLSNKLRMMKQATCQVTIIAHPGYPVRDPEDTRWRAFTAEINDEIREAKPFIARDHDIVDETDELLATPLTREEQVSSGTWTTVRYARKKKKKITIINPAERKFDPHSLPKGTNAIAGQQRYYGPTYMQRGYREDE